jgi:ABC-2 type transport system permease protein
VLLLALAALLGGAICALSDGLAPVTKQEETLIGAVQFVVLPATSLSSAMMAMNLAPGWISGAARFNPVNWSVDAARSAAASSADWSLVGVRAALLAALLAASFWLAGRAFGAYQRSV